MRVSFALGPREGLYYFLLEAVSDSGSQPFRQVHCEPAVLGEGPAEPRGDHGPWWPGRVCQVGPSRDFLLAPLPPHTRTEALFALRIELNETSFSESFALIPEAKGTAPLVSFKLPVSVMRLLSPPSPGFERSALAPVTVQSGPVPPAMASALRLNAWS